MSRPRHHAPFDRFGILARYVVGGLMILDVRPPHALRAGQRSDLTVNTNSETER